MVAYQLDYAVKSLDCQQNQMIDIKASNMRLAQKNVIILLFSLLVLFMSLITRVAAETFVDQLDRQITMPDNPQRLISLAPSITEIIYALEQENRLKGVTRYSDFPAAATKLPKIGSYVRLDLERIVALNPDLCIAIKDGNPRETIDRLDSLKIPVYVVNPRNLKTVLETIIVIGNILNAGEKAENLLTNLRDRIQRVQSLITQDTYRPGVFFQIGISPIVSVGSDTFLHELIVLAGGKNLADGKTPYPRFSREQVLALAPEIFIVTSMARQAVFDQVKAEWRRWPSMPAVRNERIFLVDSNLFDRPSPRLVDGLELLIKLIHPELLK
jgi:iron complex transport system substrate-binding protein